LIQVSGAAAYCAGMAVLVYVVNGERAIVRATGLSFQMLLLLYAATALLSGTVLGILKPFVRSSLTAALVGIPVFLPPAFAIVILSRRGSIASLTATDIWVACAGAAVFGPLVAAYYYSNSQTGKRAGEPR
jgi:hypothetical protein